MDSSNQIQPKTFALSIANYFKTGPGRNSWGPRIIQDYEFIYLVQGRGYYSTGPEKRLTVLRNETLLIPPGEEHTFSCDAQEPTTISCIHFTFHPGHLRPPVQVFSAGGDTEIHHLFRKCSVEHNRKGESTQAILNAILGEIWHRLARATMTGRSSNEPAKLTHAKRYMEQHFNSPLSRRLIARYVGITPEHLNFLFKRNESVTPMEFLTNTRLQAAKTLLLAANLNISEVAYKSGFNDPLYFSRVFKNRFGMPPREFAKSL